MTGGGEGRGGSINTSPLHNFKNIEATEMKLAGFVVYHKIFISHYDSVMSYGTCNWTTFSRQFSVVDLGGFGGFD